MSVQIITFGCRLNAGEADAIRREATQAGLTDAVIVNSCAVTSEAMAQARQSVRRMKRAQPDARIVVTGCGAQIDPAMFAAMPEVDRIVGNDDKLRGVAKRRAPCARTRATRSRCRTSWP